MGKTGITSRITIVIILVAVISAGLTGFLAYYITKEQFSLYIDQGTVSLGNRFVIEINRYYEHNGTLSGLQNYLENEPFFQIDRDGKAGLSQRVPIGARNIIVTDPDGIVTAAFKREIIGFKVSIDEHDYTVLPVTAEGKQVAVVYIFNPLKRGVISIENQFIDNIASQTTNAILITISLALIIGIMLARRITRPIAELSSAIHNLAGGNLETRVKPMGDREFIQLSEDFNYMAEQLYEHEQSRNSLVSNIAHELRTPLSILRGQLEAVQTGSKELSDEVKSSLVDEIIRLTRLVKELETVGLAESGALRLNIENIQTDEVMEKLFPLRLVMEEEKIDFQTEIAENVSCISADINRLTQVLINLLSNAMRHAAEQGGAIKFTIKKLGDFIQFSVEDNGPGIAEKDIPYIFDRFYRTDEARNRKGGGSGLGLAIARSYVRAHGGDIWAESVEGKGSIFYFTLPSLNNQDLK